jgi:hypothetical protein
MQAATLLLLFRHLHFFVIVGDLPQPPRLHLETRQYYTYADPLRVTVYGEQGDKLLSTTIPVGATLDRLLPEPAQPLYLVQADPGMNGATFDCDRPWGVMGSANHRMGVNGPGPQLYFYVPPDCTKFILGAQSVSPNEGGRLAISRPDGQEAAVLDGELDREEQATVSVPPDARDGIWSLKWGKPETGKAGLDDLNFWLDGSLTPLLFPRREWAEQYGKMLWERDRAARAD